jgi:UDP-glucose 4-epimerase
MLTAFGKVVGRPIRHRLHPRRPGDAAECWADCAGAKRELGWQAERDLDDMVRDVWRWQSNNPGGYA